MKDELLRDLAEFIKWEGTLKDLWDLIYNGSNRALYLEWYFHNPKNAKERKKFYQNSIMYLFELVRWNIERKSITNRLVRFAKEYKIKKVYDFGCGVGTDLIELMKIGCKGEYEEINWQCLGFLLWRFKKYNLKRVFLFSKADLTICLDVLEHLEKPIEILLELAKNTRYIAVNFSENFDIPMHLKKNQKYLSEYEYIVSRWKKIDTDLYEVIQ